MYFSSHNINFILGENILAEAKRRYDIAVLNGGERLISGSDDFTLFLWTPENSKNSIGNTSYLIMSKINSVCRPKVIACLII